jgi:zinc protease
MGLLALWAMGSSSNRPAWNEIARIVLAVAIAFLFHLETGPAAAQTEPPKARWPQDASDIAPDPAVVWGVLPNGMRYALMKNNLPPGAVSIRFSFDFGSLDEAEGEKGLAHFIEHMAFNGSKHVAEGDMAKALERLGLAFGPDTNASTEQKFTTYTLKLPNASDGLVDESLFLLREVASELVFDPAAIDRERGVVLAEWRRSDNLLSRLRDAQLKFLIPGAFAASRMPIGDPEILKTATSAQLTSLYDRFYRPERATLVVVGDFDIDTIRQKIASRFGDWRGRGEPGIDPDTRYTIDDRQPSASVSIERSGGDAIGIYSLFAFSKRPDTMATRKDDALLSVAVAAINRRLAERANTDDRPFRSASLSWSDLVGTADYAGASIAVTPESWRPGLQVVEQEWRRALLFGFTRKEIDQQVAIMRRMQTNAAAGEPTRSTDALAESLLFTLQNDMVFATPSSGLTRFDSWMSDVTPEAVGEVFSRRMSVRTPQIIMFSSVERPGIEKDLVDAWRESERIKVQPLADVPRKPFAYTYFGRPGKVVRSEVRDDLGARLMTFDNNVRLSLKRTAFQKNSVLVSLRVGQGAVALETAPFGLTRLMNAYSAGGLGKHSIDDLRAVLGDRSIQAGFSVYPDYFGGVYSTTPSDLALQLQVAAAYLTDPGYRPEAERNWRQAIVLGWARQDANAQAAFSNRATRLLASGDKRFGSDESDGVIYRSFTELRAYLEPVLRDAPIEIAIVGDIDEGAAIVAVARTFGALPKRQAEPPVSLSAMPVVFSHDPIAIHHQGEASQALLKEYWPVDVDPDADPQTLRVLGVLASVMRLKLIEVVREKLGASYSPAAGFSYSTVYPGLNYIFAETEMKPEAMTEVTSALKEIVTALRNGAITQDDLDRARSPAIQQLSQHATENGYWLSVLAEAQTRPDQVERLSLHHIEAGLRSITVADLQAAAKRWLTDSNLRTVEVLPQVAP